MKFLFTCGGTAGHINPALAVAGRIKEIMPDADILFIGAEGKMETELVPREGYDIETVHITNIQRSLKPDKIIHNIKTVKNVFSSRSKAKRIIKSFKPDAAIGTGGYVCYPVLKAASKLGVPTAIHESNAVPGLTTKILAKHVNMVFAGFEELKNNVDNPEKVVLTGTPVRGDFLKYTKLEARQKLGLDAEKPVVLSVWGSLGSDHMNELMVDFIAKGAKERDFHLIHSAGKRGFNKISEELLKKTPGYEKKGMDVREYIYDMHLVMAAADIVLCRAGASTIAELTAMGKPAIFVPSPNVTNNHQEKNARVAEKAGGAMVLLEGQFSAHGLYNTVNELIKDPKKRETMSENMSKLGVSDSTDKILSQILDIAEGKGTI